MAMSNISNIRRRFGLGRAVGYAACRCVQQVCLLDITHLMIKDAEKVVLRDLDVDLRCGFLNAEEVREFARDPSNEIHPDVADRIETGYDFCFAGTIGGRLASYCWIALDSVEAEHNRYTDSVYSGIAFSFPLDHAFRYKGFTHPDFRGRRIYQRVGAEASLAMQELGVRYLISTCEIVNYAALQSSYRSGYEYYGLLWLFGLGNRVVIHGPDLSDRGIRFGKHAQVLDRSKLLRTLDLPLAAAV